MAIKKKVTTTVVAVATAAALLLGGTFAWQSINQTALNESSDVVNPGGRLHDDFNGENKDVYVENFAEENIFARVRLEEFFEITQAGGTVHSIAGTRDAEGNVDGYDIHYFDAYNSTDDYWEWKTGGSTVYMPTFNKNKDSLTADINGTYDSVDDEGNRYTDYYQYTYGEKITGDAIYDYDSNDSDEYADGTGVDGEHYLSVSEEHTAKNTLGATLMSMQEWIDADSPVGEYWVYDTDGWVYWADAIQPGDATGLLLDGIALDEKLDDSWYYAINVIAQFVTADDVGKSDGTGFYDDTTGLPSPSTDAEILLEAIGVDMSGEATAPADHYLELTWDVTGKIYPNPGESILLSINSDDIAEYGEGDLSSISLFINYGVYDDEGNELAIELEKDKDYTYDSNTNILTITSEIVEPILINERTGKFSGVIGLDESADSGDEGGNTGTITDAGTIQGLNMSLNVTEDNQYFKINEATNTLYIVEPDYAWHQVDVVFEHETLDIDLTKTTRTVLLWDDVEGQWGEDEDFVIDPCYPKQLDIRCDPEQAPGLYRVEVSYDDGAGTTYEGSIEFTIAIYEEPEEPEVFENLLISTSETESTSQAYFDVSKGYATPGDTIEFGAAYMNSNFEEEGYQNVPDNYLTWSVSGNTSVNTNISETGLLTIGSDEEALSTLTILVTYKNENQGIEISTQHYVLVSNEDIVLTLKVDSDAPYYVNTEYAFTATATTASGESVDMEWKYDMSASNPEDSLNAQVEGSSFTADNGGKYNLKAYALYLPGRSVTLEVDVLGIGYVAIWSNLENVETNEPDYKVTTEGITISGAQTVYYARVYDTNGNLITDYVTATGDVAFKSVEDCQNDYDGSNDNFTASYYQIHRWGEAGSGIFSWNNQTIWIDLGF